MKISRRIFLELSTLLGSNLLLSCNSNKRINPVNSHPHIYITSQKNRDLKSISDIKESIKTGHSKKLWERIYSKVQQEKNISPYLPSSLFPGRNENAAKYKNPDFSVCHEVGQRILRASLAHLLTFEDEFKDSALEQIFVLFDDSKWPKWIDQAHERLGHPADLRTGMLSHDVALAYDWLFPSLSESEKNKILAGLDKKGIQPFLISIKQKPFWLEEIHNWLTTIVGGLGIAGMALGNDHPDAKKLIEFALPQMNKYLKIYGPNGEFNESIAYSNATQRPVGFYLAYLYYTNGGENLLAKYPFPQTCLWTMYFTLPPGRVAAFGDAHTDAVPWSKHFAAVASASKNKHLQWYYANMAKEQADPMPLLWFDQMLEPESPQDQLPLGKVFPNHGGCFVSRTEWDLESTKCIVYGKFGREENHEHNDMGQVCIDAYGERLIVDLGSPSGYPEDFFNENRWKYYNASVFGHNILMIGNREMRASSDSRGKLLQSNFDDNKGGFFQFDLSNSYEQVKSVTRTIIHLTPGIVAVLDEAELNQSEEISLRWHTIDNCKPDENGNFIVSSQKAKLSAQINCMEQFHVSFSQRNHKYKSPFDKERTGELLEQRNESFVEAKLTADKCKILTLFSIIAPNDKINKWQAENNKWNIHATNGKIEVNYSNEYLKVADKQKQWKVGLKVNI